VRIAYLAHPGSRNAVYRSIAPLSVLAQRSEHEVDALIATNACASRSPALDRLDLLHIHRHSEDRAIGLARAAKSRGVAVVWDNDDDIGALPKSSPAHRHRAGQVWSRRRRGMQMLFESVDLVTAPSATLAERLRAAGAPQTAVIENYIPDHFLLPDRRRDNGITIGWVAALEHQADVEALPIREALQRLLDTHSDVHVTTVGLGLGLRSDRYRHQDRVELSELHHAIAQFDVGIAPISDIDFNRSRSNIKVKEYAAAGVPWLASPIGPYAGMGEKQGGRLVADDRWYEELARLVDKSRERRKLARRAVKWATGEALSKNVHRWEHAFTDAIDRSRLRS
jgi:glycosyltransferase involved in cell wall biosynthesis